MGSSQERGRDILCACIWCRHQRQCFLFGYQAAFATPCYLEKGSLLSCFVVTSYITLSASERRSRNISVFNLESQAFFTELNPERRFAKNERRQWHGINILTCSQVTSEGGLRALSLCFKYKLYANLVILHALRKPFASVYQHGASAPCGSNGTA